MIVEGGSKGRDVRVTKGKGMIMGLLIKPLSLWKGLMQKKKSGLLGLGLWKGGWWANLFRQIGLGSKMKTKIK